MKLSKGNIEYLKRIGCSDADIPQIQKAIHKTTYEYDGKKVSADKVKEILGTEKYFSGLSRSAFHYSAARESDNGKMVYFDSSKLFR